MEEKLNNLDVGLKEDTLQMVMHLCASEHHCKMSFYKSQNPIWNERLDIIRQRLLC